jgi:hypothetical protein
MVAVYRKETDNIGDQISAPLLYFPFLKGSEIVDVYDGDFDLKGKNVVVGGGGPVEIFKSRLLEFRLNGPEKIVAWGVGTNETEHMYPDYSSLNGYDLVGCRDWGSPFDWVPCVSCMHTFFDTRCTLEIKNDVVQYIHCTEDKVELDFPSMTNNASDFMEVLRFFGSANVVVTNTYHGAYWATLLGKKVVIVNPWSTKFLYMRHRHVMCNKESVDKAIDRAICYPDALKECRLANTTFADKVQELFGV